MLSTVQSGNSGIIVNAHKINNGVHPNFTEKFDDFFFIQNDSDGMPDYIADLCKNRLPKKYGITDGIQIIAPTKKGLCGTQSLNFVLQNELNPSSGGKSELVMASGRVFRVGDRVMQTKNNYDKEWHSDNEYGKNRGIGVFNGDVGKICSLDIGEQILTVDFNGRIVEYQFSELDEIDLSYAVTVHKSQGSEYPIVIIPVSSKCPPMLLTRNLIYTAVTRAEKLVVIIGDRETFFKMIDNDFQMKRNTNLELLLRRYGYENQ